MKAESMMNAPQKWIEVENTKECGQKSGEVFQTLNSEDKESAKNIIRYHVEASRNMSHDYGNSCKISGCIIGNGNYKNVYNVRVGDIEDFENYLDNDDDVVEYYTT